LEPPRHGENQEKVGRTPVLIVCLVDKKRPRKLRGRFYWLPELGSNQRPADYNACALDYLITLGMTR
jgi:hypothetical protein